MTWIVQENFKDEHGYDNLITQLERQGVPYHQVKMVPFGNTIEPDLDITGPVFVVGSTSLKKVVAAKGWKPGYFDQNLDYEKLLANYGEHMLNFGGHAAEFGKTEPQLAEFFLRPCTDGKSFSGTVWKKTAFLEWRDRVVAMNGETNSYVSISPTDRVYMAPLKEINAEYRFQVVDRRVVSGSRYKRGGFIRYSSDVEPYLSAFAQRMVDIWSPCDAFVLDICTVPDDQEPRIMEINSINSAGFYECDMGQFVDAIQVLIAKKYSEAVKNEL